MIRQKCAKAVHLIHDALGTQRMPVGGGVDRDHRLFQPEFCDAGDPGKCEIGAALNDRFDLWIVDLLDRPFQRRFAFMRDHHRAWALQTLDGHHLIARIFKEPPDLRVTDRHIGGDDADPFCTTKRLDRRVAGMAAHNDRLSGLLFQAALHGFGAVGSVPEGFRRHAHHHYIGCHAHRDIDRPFGRSANIVQHDHEAIVVGDTGIGYTDPGEMIGDAARAHTVIFRLYAGVGRGCDHCEFGPVSK